MTATSLLLNKIITDFLQINAGQIDWESKPSPLKWSNKEIIGHLIDSAQINLQRFVKCTYEENFKLVYDQNTYVTVQHYQDVAINLSSILKDGNLI